MLCSVAPGAAAVLGVSPGRFAGGEGAATVESPFKKMMAAAPAATPLTCAPDGKAALGSPFDAGERRAK
eukprot:5931859-Alexandrium_andersonii.AAC.1